MTHKTVTAEILAVGTEILLGDIVNTNAQYLSKELAQLGITVLHETVVGDNPERLREAVKSAISRNDILITSGGLGPTCDDITREVTAEALNVPLEPDKEALSTIEEYFKITNRKMGENNKKQAMLPKGCTVLKNSWGTAPGCIIEKNGKTVVMLPGPPRELTAMFEFCAKPYLKKFTSGVIKSINLRAFGIPESRAEEILNDLMQGANPTLAPYAKTGEVLLRVTAKADTEEKAKSLCRPLAEKVKERLGDYVYGENVECLEEVVVKKLREKNMTVAISESCTGGLIAKRLTDIPGSSEVFGCGVVSYSPEIKNKLLGVKKETIEKYTVVSREVAFEMANGVRKLSGADIGTGVTGIAGPGGGTEEQPVGLVYVSVSDGKTCYVKKLLLGHGKNANERGYIRTLAASNVLDMVRRMVDGLSQSNSANGSTLYEMKVDDGGILL